MHASINHQYIDRNTSSVVTESLVADEMVQQIYSTIREDYPKLFRALVSPQFSKFLGFINYDLYIGAKSVGVRKMIHNLRIDMSECIEPPEFFNTTRKIFERKINYPVFRPMQTEKGVVAAPADSRILIGSFRTQSALFIKEKFFSYAELIGTGKPAWRDDFRNGDFAIFRLTPDKYHYNHLPVSGEVVDFYEIRGLCHSCNPGAVIREATPFSKNTRVVTVIDTDKRGGDGIGLVCMIEVTALMIGEVKQCYSTHWYDDPVSVETGLFVEKGQPKSRYLPGSSVTILIFQENRIQFSEDLLNNLGRQDATSRFSKFLGHPLVETDVQVRSAIARKTYIN